MSGEIASPIAPMAKPPHHDSRCQELTTVDDRRDEGAEGPDVKGPGASRVDSSAELSRRSRREERQKREARREAARGPLARAARRIPVVPVVIGVLAVVAIAVVAVWLLRGGEEEFAGERTENPGADGVILADAPPSHWETGDCLDGFDPAAEDTGATVVECEQEHNAQVLHTEVLDDGPYPGDDGVLRQTQAACEGADLVDQDPVDEAEHALEVRMSHPTQSSWGDGDRRATCTIERADGGDFTGSYVLDPDEAEAEREEEAAENDEASDGEAEDSQSTDDESTDDETTDDETEDS